MREPTDAEVADWEDRQVAQQAHGGNDHKASRGCAECRAVFEPAADQPTTEPSAMDLLVKHALLWAEHWKESIKPDYSEQMTTAEVDERDQEVRDVAALIERGLLAPAPQPGADTETEVQWGVRGSLGDQSDEVVKGQEDSARRYVKRTGEGTVMTRIKTTTYTPWEEA